MNVLRREFAVGGVDIFTLDGAVFFACGLQIDADGAPNAYHPPTPEHPKSGRPPGLDHLGNAGEPGHWWGIATTDGKGRGSPVIQGHGDPCPGFYVSTTSLEDARVPTHSPSRYVDSVVVPYFALPSLIERERGAPAFAETLGMALGDLGWVMHGHLDSGAIYADVGPSGKIGEGSIALAAALGLYRGVDAGHDVADVIFVLFPGSRKRPAWPRGLEDLRADSRARFDGWGGRERLLGMYPSLTPLPLR